MMGGFFLAIFTDYNFHNVIEGSIIINMCENSIGVTSDIFLQNYLEYILCEVFIRKRRFLEEKLFFSYQVVNPSYRVWSGKGGWS